MTAPDPPKNIDYAALKSGGIIMQKDDDFFAVRLRLPGGCISSDQLPRVAAVAEKYGRGLVRLTVRQGLEIPWIEFKKIEEARRDLEEADLTLGACGPRFRAVTACPGSSICRQGIVDSQNIAVQIDQKFGGKLLPHKFKASVSGCPNG
jgi:dissimilatory sulfite reductase (desulfoviridin) alpha/beta subunit